MRRVTGFETQGGAFQYPNKINKNLITIAVYVFFDLSPFTNFHHFLGNRWASAGDIGKVMGLVELQEPQLNKKFTIQDKKLNKKPVTN